MKYIRAKQFIPNIHFLWCYESGQILEDQTNTPVGEIEDNMTDEEIMNDIRNYRNELLRLSDWTQLPDVNLDSDSVEKWKSYRQELRDFPSKIDVQNWSGPYWPSEPTS